MSVFADLSWQNANLRLEIRDLKAQIASYESGEMLRKIRETHRRDLSDKDREIRNLKAELAKAYAFLSKMRKNWLQVFDDVQKEAKKKVEEKESERAQAEKSMWEALQERDNMEQKLREERLLRYEAQTKAQETQEKLDELNSRLNKDYTNSSKPSSQTPDHKKIANSREATDRNKGAQPGHRHHERKKLEPTMPTVELAPPDEYLDTEKYRPTGKVIRKQLVSIQVVPQVIEFTAQQFRNLATGVRVHAPFPFDLADDVTYDGTVKAFAWLLNNECCVSLEKTKEFIKDITGGKIDLSIGMIAELKRQFSEKTQEERDKIFLDLMSSPTLHADFTFGRMDGKQTTVIICASGKNVLYQGREKKGNEGVKGSPAEVFQGILISDHEAAFVNLGTEHQECLSHVQRYLISIMENEPGKKWSTQMHTLIQEMIHYRNSLHGEEKADEEKIREFEERYDNVLQKAKEEYEEEPPADWFRDGYNLYKRMLKDKEDYLLFLKNPGVEPTNNLAERCARRFKRKNAQMMCFRSQEGVNNFCDGLSIVESLKSNGDNLFVAVADRFGAFDMGTMSAYLKTPEVQGG